MPNKVPTNSEVIGAVILTAIAVTFFGIGAIATITWILA
jgi:hypothetical protein